MESRITVIWVIEALRGINVVLTLKVTSEGKIHNTDN